MTSFSLQITDPMGLHARPAGQLVRAATRYASAITLCCRGQQRDLKRLFAVLSLGARVDDVLTVTAEGTDEEAACQGLKEFMEGEGFRPPALSEFS